MIRRYGAPSKYDQSPYGTLCKSGKEGSNVFAVYIQMNEDDEFPLWEKIGMFAIDMDDVIIEEANRILNIKQFR